MSKFRSLFTLLELPFGNYIFTVCFVFILVIAIPSASEGKSKEGFFIGVGVTNVSIGGDFDGVSFVSGGGSAEVFPKLEDAQGMKYVIGFQSKRGTIDFNYCRSEHDGNWAGLNMEAVFKSYNFDLKGLLLQENYIIRPLVVLGFGFNSLTVKDGSTDGFNVADATFRGLDVRFGGGLELSLHERLAIDAQAVYRWGRYNKVEGIVDGSLDDIDGNGPTYSGEVKFIF